MIAAMPSLATADFVAAKVNYAAVSPMLVVFGVALVGVLVEAFAPRSRRYAVQVTLSLAGLVGALVALVVAARDNTGSTLEGAVVVDGPALFLQGTLLVLSVLGVLTMAERFDGTGADAFTRWVPRSRARRTKRRRCAPAPPAPRCSR